MSGNLILDECSAQYFGDLIRELYRDEIECCVEITKGFGSEPFLSWEGSISNPDIVQFAEGPVIAFEIGSVSLELDAEYMFCYHQSTDQTILCAGIRPENDEDDSPYTIWINAEHQKGEMK